MRFGNDNTIPPIYRCLAAYGGEIGYDFTIGSTAIGPYVGLDFAETGYCSEVSVLDEAFIEAGPNISVGIRAGVPVVANTLLYRPASTCAVTRFCRSRLPVLVSPEPHFRRCSAGELRVAFGYRLLN